MTITTSKLTRVAGMCAVVAGLLFLLPHFIHPEDEVAQVVTTQWAVAHMVNTAMGVLALIGITGLYLRQVRETGALGLIGFVVFGIGFLMIAIVSFAETVILPQIADTDPRYVSDVLATLVGDPVRGDVGGLTLANGVAGITYLLGGLVFGIALYRAGVVALYRAGVVARWAALLLAIGSVASLLAGVLPDSMFRTGHVPDGHRADGTRLLAVARAGGRSVDVRSQRPHFAAGFCRCLITEEHLTSGGSRKPSGSCSWARG